MRAALYARVSTAGQKVDNQLIELREVAKTHGWETVEYIDVISGATHSRPQLDLMLKSVMRGEIQMVAAWDVSRLGRSLQHLTGLLADIHAKQCDLYLHQQGIDTTTPSGKAMFGMMGVFAEFERSMIRERVNAGLDRARAQGKRLGRPPVSPAVKRKVMALRADGLSMAAVGRAADISPAMVHKIVHANKMST
jgi:DNA invertase Pin-like site-specific DNA recombinase